VAARCYLIAPSAGGCRTSYHPEKCEYSVRFGALACSVSRSTPVRADPAAVTRGCRGGLGPSAAPLRTSLDLACGY